MPNIGILIIIAVNLFYVNTVDSHLGTKGC